MNSRAAPETKRCGGNCQDVRYFNSGGRMRLIALTAAPYWTKSPWRFRVKAGPALFRVQWDATATDQTNTTFWGPQGQKKTFTTDPHWEVGTIAGVSVAARFRCATTTCSRSSTTSAGQLATCPPAGAARMS
ncbi:hypothetical protein [Paraburkholderia terrae]|uniref:hypothetical protein n=1 Tax=Paraburkholderia terrae TaxID=311230 RepID=UPI001E30D080|nr:hypothetical protein [Paraburkholderia terrae]